MFSAVGHIGPTNQWLYRWGTVVLWTALAIGLSSVLYFTWTEMIFIPAIPIVIIGGALALALFKRPALNMVVVLSGFVLIVGFEEGLQPGEILYGMYYMGYLAFWFIHRYITSNEPLCPRPEERALLLFLVLITLSIPISLLFHASPGGILGEWLSFSLLAFYWPVRDIIKHDERGLKIVLGTLIFIGLFVLIRNLFEYRSTLNNAEYAWQIARGRAVTNESLLMVPSFISLTIFLFAKERLTRYTFFGMFLTLYAGLILTQSRAYWVASFIGLVVIFLLVPKSQKTTLVFAGVTSAAGLLAAAYLLLGDLVVLILSSFFYRFMSLQNALTNDPSLVNRFLETAGVWEHIKVNPVLGYGMGVPYRFYNITYLYSESKAFVHNGYVALLFKFGVWGLGLMLVSISGFILRSFQSLRRIRLTPRSRMSSQPLNASHSMTGPLIVLASFAALLITALTANPFFQNDLMFVFALLWGISSGVYADSDSKSVPAITT